MNPSLAERVRAERGERHTWASACTVLGAGRAAILARAETELERAHPGVAGKQRARILAVDGVAFGYGPFRVKLYQPDGRAWHVFIRPLRADEVVA